MDLPRNFSWLRVNLLAGCACPASELELVRLSKVGVSRLVSLSSEDTPPPACSVAGLLASPLPVPEFRGPTISDYLSFFQMVDETRSGGGGGGAVAVHCRMGRGRTGCLLAGYLVKYEGMTAGAAIQAVRQARPGSVETRDQEESLTLLQNYLGQHEKLTQICV